MLRVGRYEAAPLAQCMESLGWYEVGAWGYGGEHALRLYRKGARGPCAGAETLAPVETIDAGAR